MQTQLSETLLSTAQGQEADAILRSCVHCGFCNATCPTYQLLGDELDGPRGRIYLIKSLLEDAEVTRTTQLHLDRCLSCRACETTCPSGVQYGRLADIGRGVIEQRVKRPWRERVLRRMLRVITPYPARFAVALRLAQWCKPLLPARLRRSVPPRQKNRAWPVTDNRRRMLILDGCAQPALAPNINAAAARVLDKLNISLIRPQNAGCCGAISYHLGAHEEGLNFMRRNITAWWPHIIKGGAKAIVITASGCGSLVKEYGHLLQHDPDYAEKAARVSAMTHDISEVLVQQDLSVLKPVTGKKIACHAPCSLQHAQKLPGAVENILGKLGFELTDVPDAHLCCGSAGTYSITQPELSQELLKNKLTALQSGSPECIVTANIGCLAHMQSASNIPVKHWIELLDTV
ncbi:MAG: glycolate oxidase subunit GlcF [Gammaproteobacteria bacterium]|nr:glycolate oxidase subunit GlcF [Gammaproteobacteria bacterium]